MHSEKWEDQIVAYFKLDLEVLDLNEGLNCILPLL